MVVALAPDADGLRERRRAHRDDEVLLERELVARVRAAVDHVEARHRQHELVVAGDRRDVLVQRHARRLGARLARGHRDAEDGVRTEVALVRGAVRVAHELVQCGEVHDALALDELVDLGVHVRDRSEATLAKVSALVAVAQLHSLVDARGRARRDHRPGHDAALGEEVNLHRYARDTHDCQPCCTRNCT